MSSVYFEEYERQLIQNLIDSIQELSVNINKVKLSDSELLKTFDEKIMYCLKEHELHIKNQMFGLASDISKEIERLIESRQRILK